jgi:hypothetical protein
MENGIYSITFRGAADWGMGLLVFLNGVVTGADSGGVTYDGRYTNEAGFTNAQITMTVPPGAVLVQGSRAQPTTYQVPFAARVPHESVRLGTPILLELPPGPVNVIFKKLRALS